MQSDQNVSTFVAIMWWNVLPGIFQNKTAVLKKTVYTMNYFNAIFINCDISFFS